MKPLVEIKDLTIGFQEGKTISPAVKGISFEVPEKSIVTLIGANGAGKSTTLRLLSGMKKPQRGEISVKGTLGMLPQNPQTLFVKKTVREDLFEIFSGTKTPRPGTTFPFFRYICNQGVMVTPYPT